MTKHNDMATLTVLSSGELSNISGGGALGGHGKLPLRTVVNMYDKPGVWKQEFNRAKELLGSVGHALSLGDRNIARDYANQSAFHGHGYASPTASAIRAGYGME